MDGLYFFECRDPITEDYTGSWHVGEPSLLRMPENRTTARWSCRKFTAHIGLTLRHFSDPERTGLGGGESSCAPVSRNLGSNFLGQTGSVAAAPRNELLAIGQ
jgi:hypothetical protein